MKRVAIIQARMNSTRLPGKVLLDVGGRPMLAQQLRRLRRCSAIDEIIVATTTSSADDAIVTFARREGIGWFCGSEEDVLGRYVGAACQAEADVIVRITADNPLIDPQVVDRVIDELVDHTNECDYASNCIERSYPFGLHAEAFFWDTLARMNRLAQSWLAREHVTILLRSERPDLFLCRSVVDTEDNSDLRWTVDTVEDLQLIRVLYERLNLGRYMLPYTEIVAYVRSHPELAVINAHSETWDPTMKIPG